MVTLILCYFLDRYYTDLGKTCFSNKLSNFQRDWHALEGQLILKIPLTKRKKNKYNPQKDQFSS